MSLKPQPPRPLAPEIAAWGAAYLPTESPYRLIGDTLYDAYRDEDFADLYPAEGHPALSPVLLSLVTIFQTLENLSDRATATAVRTRLDWKYALHLPFADGGFDASVLCEFRKRLIAHHAEGRVFDQVLGQLKALGLVKQRGIQRTDSLSVLSRARELGRIELVFETLRVALRALLKTAPDWLPTVLPTVWAERYRYHCRQERQSDAERAQLTEVIGDDGQWLLDCLAQADVPGELGDLPAIALLRTVWEQHFERVGERMQFRKPGGYDGTVRIQTPYDPEARWSQKRSKGWVGYKLQVTETDDAAHPHLLTDIAVRPAVEDDRSALNRIADRQQVRDVVPGQRYADQGYMSGPNLLAADQRGEDLVGRIGLASSPQSRMGNGFTHADFQIDLVQRRAICPAGQVGTPKDFVGTQDSGDRGTTFTFQKQHCRVCPLKARCVTGKKEQRFLVIRSTYTRVQQARARQQTEGFKAAYKQHRPGVEGCLSALVRGQGIRRCRYAGQAKNHLRVLFIGAAINLARGAAWVAGKRHRPKRQGLVWAPARG